jgi:hypothetical protein
MAFINSCRFVPTAGGTTDWTYSTVVTGFQSPTAAGAVNATPYSFRAESADGTQWEDSQGNFTSATGVFARTTVLYNSSGTGTGAGQTGAGTKINFTAVPQVQIVALAEDLRLLAPLASPTFTGVPAAPTEAANNNSTQLATTAYADAIAALKANLASPTFTGTPAAPTPAAGTNTTQLATTAFVIANAILTNVRIFTSSSTYPTVTNGSVKVLVMCKGGGGGGGGTTGPSNCLGGGGGEGSESWKLTTASALSAQTVSVGAGGSSVAANTNSIGGTGGASSIGAIVSASPGGGGNSANNGGFPGAGGNGGTYDWHMPGDPGQGGSIGVVTAGLYGGSGGGKGAGIAQASSPVANSGGGGCGGVSTTVASTAGGSGIVVCYEFGAI